MKHTPGPWKIWEAKKSEYVIRKDDSIGELVITATPGSSFRQNDLLQFKKNIDLITAAPDLLQNLKTALYILNNGTETHEDFVGVIELIENAINKAEGNK